MGLMDSSITSFLYCILLSFLSGVVHLWCLLVESFLRKEGFTVFSQDSMIIVNSI